MLRGGRGKGTKLSPGKKKNSTRTPAKRTKTEQSAMASRDSSCPSSSKGNDESGQGKRNSSSGAGERDEELECCYFVYCTNPARPGSKYCSDDCGIKLAMYRIQTILPKKLEELSVAPSRAELKNKEDFDRVRMRIQETVDLFEILEGKRKKLDQFIDEVALIKYEPEKEKMKGQDPNRTAVVPMWCALCGKDVNSKGYAIHVERCFSKFEKRMVLETKTPANVSGTKIFCDHFNPKTQVYCKRFHVLCPEHYTRKPCDDSAICGSPASDELVQESICRESKAFCVLHVNWENLMRANIDLEKANAWIKLEKLLSEEKQLLQSMDQRRSVLGLLLNNTTTESPERTQ